MNPKYQTISLEIPNGEKQSATKRIRLEQSLQNQLVSVSSSHNEDVSVSIDYSGSTIVPFLPITFYDGKQGSFDERALELDFQDGRNLEVNAKASQNVGQLTKITVVFKRYETQK